MNKPPEYRQAIINVHVKGHNTMKKTFKLVDLDCAHCAAKMEDAIKKLPGVTNASVNFLQQKLTLEAADDQFDAVLKAAMKCCKDVEPDCTIKI